MEKFKKALILGTKNKGKIKEIQTLLAKSGVRVLSLDQLPSCPESPETGRTLEANARQKARHYSSRFRAMTLADDSGLMVRQLKNAPGVYSARFAGPGCSYEDNNRKLLRLLAKTPLSKRKAAFVCVMALYDSKKFIGVVRGECRGRIAFSMKGRHGFGYDPVFIPEGFTKTFAQLSLRTKNKISHRAKALKAAKKLILNYCEKV